jgi:anti-anti-sigma factor
MRCEPKVTLDVRQRQCGRTLWLGLQGILNCYTTDVLREHVRADRIRSCRRVVADLTRLEYVGGNGLHALLKLRDELAARGIELRLVVLQGGRCARTLALAKLDGLLATFTQHARAWRQRGRTPRPVTSGPTRRRAADHATKSRLKEVMK